MFLHRLALALGRTVGELLETTDADEIRDWMAFDRIEPFGPWRDDVRTAAQTAALINVHRKRGNTVKMKELLPRFGERYKKPKAEPSAEKKLKAVSRSGKR